MSYLLVCALSVCAFVIAVASIAIAEEQNIGGAIACICLSAASWVAVGWIARGGL